MSIEKTLQDLTHPEEQVRKRAVLQLAQNVDMRAIPALMKVCKADESLEIRFYAKKTLVLYRKRLVEEKARRSKAIEVPPEFLAQATESHFGAPTPASAPKAPGPATGSKAGAMPVQSAELERLYGELDDEDSKTRIKAIMALVQVKDSQLLPRLRRMDKMEDCPKVRAALVLAFGLLGGPGEIDIVIPYLSEPDARIRANALEALKRLGAVRASSDIARLLKDNDRKVKNAALETLRGFPETELFEAIQQMLSSTDVKTRDVAAYSLLKLEIPSSLPLIVSILSDTEMSIRLKARNALVVLAKNGCQEAYTALSRHAGERQSPESFMTMSVIEKRPKLDKLADPRPRERMRAVQDIVDNDQRERIPELLQALLREKDQYVRATIVVALGRLKAEDAVGSLKVFLEDDDNRIRANAVEALGAIGGNDIYPLLIPFLEDANNRVRANAIVGLGQCPYIQLDLPLKKMVNSSEVLMRRSAIYAMVELRRADLVPLLDQLLDDSEPIVRDKAADALRVLATEGFDSAQRIVADRRLND